MKKSIVFEGILVVLLILIGFIFYVMIAGNPAPGSYSNHSILGIKTNAGGAGSWAVSGIGPVSDIHIDDGMLYTFMGDTSNTIDAISLNGDVKWTYNVSDKWRVKNAFYDANNIFTSTKTVYDVSNGVLYLYIRENRTTFWNHLLNEDHPDQPLAGDYNLEDRLTAISANGSLLWNVPISEEHHIYGDTELTVKNDRIYVFDNYTITVLNSQGSFLYRIQNVSNWPAIDENGYVYMIPAVLLNQPPADIADIYKDEGYMVPSSAIEAYNPIGDLYWHKDLGTTIISPLLYQNGTIWAPIQNGIFALDTNGSIKWSKHYDIATGPFWAGSIGLYSLLPLDSQGNVYMYEVGTGDPMISKKSIHIVANNGTETVRDANSFTPREPNVSTLFTMQYYSGASSSMSNRSGHVMMPVDYMMNCTLTANDAFNNNNLWSYNIVPAINVTILTNDNLNKLLNPKFQYKNATLGTFIDSGPVNILQGKNVLFVTYSCANIESPVIVNQSECGYAVEIYAFDKKSGSLLLMKSLDALITSSSVHDDTLYYGTLDGKIIAQSIGG